MKHRIKLTLTKTQRIVEGTLLLSLCAYVVFQEGYKAGQSSADVEAFNANVSLNRDFKAATLQEQREATLAAKAEFHAVKKNTIKKPVRDAITLAGF